MENIDILKNKLIVEIRNMIEIIKSEYPMYVDLPEDLDLENRVYIEDTGTISLFVKNKNIYFPLSAFSVLEHFKSFPEYGSNTNHVTYTEDNMIINDNTFETFINHAIVKGMTAEDYFKEILLHEVMHFCGIGGWLALREGINELRTRQLAKKYGLLTSCCGYPKETKIAYELEQILGKDVIDRIAFTKKSYEVIDILNELPMDAATLYLTVEREMEKEFQEKYMKYKFPGINGPFEKMKKYDTIDYSRVYEIIDEYKRNQDFDSNKKITM